MWDDRFASETYMFGTEPAQALVRHLEALHPSGTTLAVADGEGRNSVFLARNGFDVTAMDSSKVGIAKAQKLSTQHGVAPTFELADIYDYDWHKQRYDNVVAIFIQFVPPEMWPSVFEGLKSALRKGGVLMLHGYTPKQVEYGTGGPSNPVHMYTTEMLASAFADMDILINDAYEADLDEGPGHNGRSALIDFIAIKK